MHQELAMKFAHFTSGKSITSQLSVHTAKEQEKARVALQKMFGVVFLDVRGCHSEVMTMLREICSRL